MLLEGTIGPASAVRMLDSIHDVQKLIAMLIWRDYKCGFCGKLLASGAECPRHPKQRRRDRVP